MDIRDVWHLLALIILAAWAMALIRTIVNLGLIPRLHADMRSAYEPLVSVIIPARDEARIIEQTVRAFLAQTYANLEVVVVNDRSADGTGDIVRAIHESQEKRESDERHQHQQHPSGPQQAYPARSSPGSRMANRPRYGGLASLAAVSVQISYGSLRGNMCPSSSINALAGPR